MDEEYKKGDSGLTGSICLGTGVMIGAGSFATHAKIPLPSINLH